MQKVYKSTILLIAICSSVCSKSFAQSTKNTSPDKTKVTISGNFIVATDFKSVYTSYGGPSVKFSFSKNTYACISMFPSLRWKSDSIKPDVLPILGTGILIGYKRLILAIPVYYITNENKWKVAGGAGIKF